MLAYVRDPASLYLSAVQHTLKAGHLFVGLPPFGTASLRHSRPGGRSTPIAGASFRPHRLVDGDVVRDFLAEASASSATPSPWTTLSSESATRASPPRP